MKCHAEMICEKNGITVIKYLEYSSSEKASISKFTISGIEPIVTSINVDALVEGSWKDGDIDFIVIGDLYKCPTCGFSIVSEFGQRIVYGVWSQKRLKALACSAIKNNTALILAPLR